jgi:superfamily I DNA/RNA helicase
MNIKPQVALSQDFLSKMVKIPHKVQAKILKWSLHFQSDPTATGINYEKLTMCKDKNLRSVRINQDWRGIVFQPPKGNVYVLMYVDHHDDAYRWAKNRKIVIHPSTGALQIVVTEEIHQSVLTDAVTQTLYGELTDQELLSLGTPVDLLTKVRQVVSEDDLDAMENILPVEAFEGLFLVAAGDTVTQVLAAREVFMPETVDVEDYDKAFDTPESQSRFFVLKDDDALITAMNSPLELWRIFLHPSQKRFAIGDRNGPMRVLGGAGTGKTVLAMHRAVWLAEHRTGLGQKVLFTTFTRNLAVDIEQNLKKLCTPSIFEKIEVINLDAWVFRFLRQRKYLHRILFDYKKDELALKIWENALTIRDTSIPELDEIFYREEWENIIQSQGIENLNDYRKARRVGRKKVLTRKKRDAIWPVFEEYRTQLSSNKLKEFNDAYRDAATEMRNKGLHSKYSAIVVDETQDFGSQALKLLRAMIVGDKNDLFFAGDGHQRIYKRNRAVMGQCGIKIQGRARKLYLNYRTTDEIRHYALGILEGREIDDMDGGCDENKRYKSLSHGPNPRLEKVENLEAAAKRILKIIKDWTNDQEGEIQPTTCVIASKSSILSGLQTRLEGAGTSCVILSRNKVDERNPKMLRLSTMHRAKGLEFDQVIVLLDGALPKNADESDNTPNLVYVALTRARRHAALIELSLKLKDF